MHKHLALDVCVQGTPANYARYRPRRTIRFQKMTLKLANE